MATPAQIGVLVVEDSPTVRELLVHILGTDPGLRILGTASDGEEALVEVRRRRPDVITMDIHMPRMDGLEATRRIMETAPTPIVLVSGSEDPRQVATTFDAMEAGALAVLRRPVGPGHPDHVAMASELVQTVKLMAEVRVVRRWPRSRLQGAAPRPVARESRRVAKRARIVAIGASTGGPPVLETILAGLPKDFPLPVLIVQHMAAGFVTGFVDWLARTSTLPVHVARQGELLLAGHAYVAPDALQMRIDGAGRVALAPGAPVNGLCPSVSVLFRSIEEVFGGAAIAGLLSGMGRDGADELQRLRAAGAVTFAQDQESSVVHGMPGEAIRLDAAAFVLSPEKIAGVLTSVANHGTARGGVGDEDQED